MRNKKSAHFVDLKTSFHKKPKPFNKTKKNTRNFAEVFRFALQTFQHLFQQGKINLNCQKKS